MSTGCRFCGAAESWPFVDLGPMPPANRLLPPAAGPEAAGRHPLAVRVCGACHLAQLDYAVPPEDLFSDYVYFSSYSQSWLEHAQAYAVMATERLGLGPDSQVVEVASNDGYLLQYFQGPKVLGVEPAANVAAVATAAGIPTEVAFFGQETAHRLRAQGIQAHLMVANNVLAHVPDLNDFIAGFALLLAPGGVWTVEAPHLLRLIEGLQFDTIYHEHYSYLRLAVVDRMVRAHGLAVFDVEELPTHGGSLRYWIGRPGETPAPSPAVARVLAAETAAALDTPAPYAAFGARCEALRDQVRAHMAATQAAGETVVGFGAAAKGITLLNYCGLTPADVPFVVDSNPHKQGLIIPGCGIPVRDETALWAARPDQVWILPWNLEAEIAQQCAGIAEWGGRFLITVPSLRLRN